MNKTAVYLIIVAVVITTVCMVVFACHPKDDFSYIEGYWTVIPEFASTADIHTSMLFIGQPIAPNIYPAQLNIDDTISEPLDIIVSLPRRNILAEGPHEAQCKLKFTCETPPIPTDLTIEFDTHTGVLRLYDNSQVYGAWYKDHEITAMYS